MPRSRPSPSPPVPALRPELAAPRRPAPERPPPSWLCRDRTLFLVALALRLAAVIVFHERGARGGLELGTLADALVAGDGFTWDFYGSDVPRRSFFPPFYPFLIAGLKLGAGAWWPLALQVLQAGAGALAPLAVRRLGRELVQPGLAWTAAYLAAGWPPAVLYTAEVFPVTFHVLGVPTVLWLVARAARSGGVARGALRAGVGYGILAYSLPSFLGSLALMPLGLRASGWGWRRSLALPGLALVVALAVLLPWTVRNAVVQHRLVPVATNLGFNFLGANHAEARLNANVLCAYDEIRWRVIDRQQLESMNEVDFDRAMLAQGLRYVAEHPVQTARRMGTRLLYYWWISPDMVRYNRLYGLGGMVLMSVVLPVFLWGLVVSWRLRHQAPFGVLHAACLWVTLFYMNFAVRGRYSLGIQPVMLVLATLGAAHLWSLWRQRRAPAAVTGSRE